VDQSTSTVASTSCPDTSLLLEEYKIIQAKIDKLGEDMFKVRSWCITLFTGVLAGANLAGGLSRKLLWPLAVIVLAFQFVENRQRQVSRRSAKRGQQIESILRRTLRVAGAPAFLAPRLATQLLRQGQRDRIFRSGRVRPAKQSAESEKAQQSDTTSDGVRYDRHGSRTRLANRIIAQADWLFYVAQYLIIGILFLSTGQTAEPKPNERSLRLQVGTNTFTLTVQETNVVVTNYVVHTIETTNFNLRQAYTTNYIVRTNYVFITNTVRTQAP